MIAQQVLCIQQAIIMNVKEFEFESKIIPLNTSFGVFITMNPGKEGAMRPMGLRWGVCSWTPWVASRPRILMS